MDKENTHGTDAGQTDGAAADVNTQGTGTMRLDIAVNANGSENHSATAKNSDSGGVRAAATAANPNSGEEHPAAANSNSEKTHPEEPAIAAYQVGNEAQLKQDGAPTAGRSRRKNAGDGKDAKNGKQRTGILWEIWEWIKILVVAAVAAYLLNTYIIANSNIPTGSMQDTIMAGDRVFGSRLTYTFGNVERGDVAIFIYGYACTNCGATYRETEAGVCPNCGQADSKNKEIYYVKRIIGLPGDTIEIKQTGETNVSEFTEVPIQSSTGKVPTGAVYVNGELLDEPYLPEPMLVGASFANGLSFPEFTGDNKIVVPDGCYFVMGDNRNNSQDARFWGENMFVKRDRMLAKVYVKYWPLTDIGLVK